MNEIHSTDDQLRSEIDDLRRQLEERLKSLLLYRP